MAGRGSGGSKLVRALAAVPAVFGLAGCWPGSPPTYRPGDPLPACPSTPNCVSTQATDPVHAMPAIPFDAPLDLVEAETRRALLAEPRTTLVAEAAGYLHAESRSRVFRFIDDVQILIDPEARVVHFRSAARVGNGDLGVNRARMERFTERLRKALEGQRGGG
jgi:uncharacterized protein (DUF1499 family)